MKQEIANWSLLIGSSIALLSVFIKFVLWIGLRSPKRIGFFKSFVVWFSKNDIHDASSKRSRIFLYWSNLINILLWTSVMLLLIAFVFDTDSVDTNLPQPTNRRR